VDELSTEDFWRIMREADMWFKAWVVDETMWLVYLKAVKAYGGY
jgi:hypothetical protein